MVDLSELTIIVPSFNRQRFVFRQMEFWAKSNVNLHILDGSEIPLALNGRFDEFQKMNYHHMPFSLYERFSLASDLIDTKYAVFLGDDEFYIPHALLSCIENIENYDLAACGGLALAFYHERGEIFARNRFYGMRGLSIDDSDPTRRMFKSMDPVLPSVIYAVHRSEIFKNNLKMFKNFRSTCAGTSEVQFTLMTCLRGKTKIIDELLWLRSNENQSVNSESWITKYNLHDWYADETKKAEFEQFYQVMLDVASVVPNINSTDLRSALEQAVAQCVAYKSNRKRNQKLYDRFLISVLSFAQFVPRKVRNLMKPPFDRMMQRLDDKYEHYTPLALAASCLSDEGVYVDFDGLGIIEESVKSFYREC
jgi:glycosyltransferase domain-containing protein